MDYEHVTEKIARLWQLLIDLWLMIRPRPWLLASGLTLMAISRLASLALPASSKYLIDEIIGKHKPGLLFPLAGFVIAAAMIEGLSEFVLAKILPREAQRIIASLRCRVQKHIVRLPLAFYNANGSGALAYRIMNDVEGLRTWMGTGLVQLLGSVLTGLYALLILLAISARMTALAVGVLIVFGLTIRYFFARIHSISMSHAELYAKISGRLTESLTGIRVVKGYNAEAREAIEFTGEVQKLLANAISILSSSSLLTLMSTSVLGVMTGLIIFLGADQIFVGRMTVGAFVEFTIFLTMLLDPVRIIVDIGPMFSSAVAGLERTRDILAEKSEDADPARRFHVGVIRGEVLFEKVTFSYESGKLVLTDVTFEAKPGTVTALVGPSGAGKSTLIALIAAFYTPTRGRILVDGIDLGTLQLDSYRKQLGIVLQDAFLFNGTLYDNVAFSRPDASEDEVLSACRMARVDEFAERLENRYQTLIGERGAKLSGGQRQRVCIARAILANPRILILDEATSNLDTESETLIQGALASLMVDRTSFVIAHRLSTIRQAHQIILLENGQIRELGTHDTLYLRRGRYYELYNRQHALEENQLLIL